jgi:uncharacterized protein (DUF427 family)
MLPSNVQRVAPGPGQESVWDYPRPPRAELTTRHIQVILAGQTVADTRRAVRVLETSQAPVYYIPLVDVDASCLLATPKVTLCEWKGRANYFTVAAGGRRAENAAWTYRAPFADYETMREAVAFYPHLMDECLVDGERATAMPGGFYGGWITRDIVGPFKGGPGTLGW